METALISRGQVAELLTLDICIDAVESAFRLLGEGKVARPETLGVHVADGGFHVKAGAAALDREWFAAKINANFPRNPDRFGLPTIQGLVCLFDAENGEPLALLDSTELTALRTAAATGVAAKHLARPDSTTATVVGCGRQGKAQLRALGRVLQLGRAFALDADPARAEGYANDMASELAIEVTPVEDLPFALSETDVLVTCTPSRTPFVRRKDVRPGTFIAAVGADDEGKHEIEEALMAASVVVVDLLPQAALIGDLHHAIARGHMRVEDVRAELGAVVAGRAPGRTSLEEITIFDSTGIALQDLVAAVAVYERALGRAARFNFAG
ncbi:MAG TPA: ornithine cyclodeaminase family protein [Vicinamibacteria bacterium]|nr:ornithine cyclodeaminase family protein [Vicinamibacteria bacterium]